MTIRHINRMPRADRREIVDAIACQNPERYPTFYADAAERLDLGEAPQTRNTRAIGLSVAALVLAALILADSIMNATFGAELLLLPAFLGVAGWLAWEVWGCE